MARNTNRYQNILIESAKLFRRKGFLATSIRDIGDALDITSAALYYHFKNKDELLEAVMEIALDRLRGAIEEATSADSHPAENIRQAMRAHLRISTDYQDFAIVLLQEIRHLSPEARGRVVAKRDAYEALWTEWFIEAQEMGVYKSHVDVRLLRLLTFGAINLVVTWFQPTGKYSAEQIADMLYEYASNGVMQAGLMETLAAPY